jgi:hypothetical protein
VPGWVRGGCPEGKDGNRDRKDGDRAGDGKERDRDRKDGDRDRKDRRDAGPDLFSDLEHLAAAFAREIRGVARQAEDAGEDAVGSLGRILGDTLNRIRTEVFKPQDHPAPPPPDPAAPPQDTAPPEAASPPQDTAPPEAAGTPEAAGPPQDAGSPQDRSS